jgi:hypothetical protein
VDLADPFVRQRRMVYSSFMSKLDKVDSQLITEADGTVDERACSRFIFSDHTAGIQIGQANQVLAEQRTGKVDKGQQSDGTLLAAHFQTIRNLAQATFEHRQPFHLIGFGTEGLSEFESCQSRETLLQTPAVVCANRET